MALVLTRREGERIIITTPAGETITVTVNDIGRDRVRLEIAADKNVRIDREEIDAARREAKPR